MVKSDMGCANTVWPILILNQNAIGSANFFSDKLIEIQIITIQ